jgi:integrase
MTRQEEDRGSATTPAVGSDFLAAKLKRLTASVTDVTANNLAVSTRSAYRSDWNDFELWATAHGLDSLAASPTTLAMYLADLAGSGAAMNTAERRLAAIRRVHLDAQLADPTKTELVRSAMTGLRRTYGRPEAKSAAITLDALRAMLDAAPPGLTGSRDRALLLVGLAGALRRSELVALDVEHVLHVGEKGILVTLERSKTDQGGAGQVVAIPRGEHIATCPVEAYDTWLQQARISSGAVFRSIDRHGHLGGRLGAGSVDRLVKAYAHRAGLDQARPGETPPLYSAHSLRAGLATAAAASGVEERVIQRQTRHKSVAVLRGYIRDGELFADNAAGRIGL